MQCHHITPPPPPLWLRRAAPSTAPQDAKAVQMCYPHHKAVVIWQPRAPFRPIMVADADGNCEPDDSTP